MSPQLKSVEAAGIAAVELKSSPERIGKSHFFHQPEVLKARFGELIEADANHCAIVPSVSYGIANVINNITLATGDEILIVDEQFPSNVYPWKRLAERYNAAVNISTPPNSFEGRGKLWNESLLAAITHKTKVVAMPQVHWADGTIFDLKKIRAKTKEVGQMAFRSLLLRHGLLWTRLFRRRTHRRQLDE